MPVKWREVEPFVWRAVDGEDFLSAEVVDGRIARFGFEWVSPFMVFEPMPAHLSPVWLTPALLAGFLALLLTTIAWPVSALVRRHYRAPIRSRDWMRRRIEGYASHRLPSWRRSSPGA